MEIHERIKAIRKKQHLTQEYVANYLGLNRPTVTQMENGNRSILADDITKLSALFGVSADTLVNAQPDLSKLARKFARRFEQLDEEDQEEIMYLIRFMEKKKSDKS